MQIEVRMILPEFYYSINVERYAKSYIRRNYPDMTFKRMDGRYAVCIRTIEEKPLSLISRQKSPRRQNKLV